MIGYMYHTRAPIHSAQRIPPPANTRDPSNLRSHANQHSSVASPPCHPIAMGGKLSKAGLATKRSLLTD